VAPLPRRFPPPWTAEQIPGGFVVKDATGQALAYCYGREKRGTMDEARHIAANIAKLPAAAASDSRSFRRTTLRFPRARLGTVSVWRLV
jgi:hypothetical protein